MSFSLNLPFTSQSTLIGKENQDASERRLDPRLHEKLSNLTSTWSYETKHPISLEALQEVAKKLPGTIYRCKGVIYAAEQPDTRLSLQIVGRRIDVSSLGKWQEKNPMTKIVAIGRSEAISPKDLEERFQSCITEISETVE